MLNVFDKKFLINVPGVRLIIFPAWQWKTYKFSNHYSNEQSLLSCNQNELQTDETNQHVTTLIPLHSTEFVSNFSLMVSINKTRLNLALLSRRDFLVSLLFRYCF